MHAYWNIKPILKKGGKNPIIGYAGEVSPSDAYPCIGAT